MEKISRYTVKGVNNDEETCSHCGRTNLKRVVWLSALDADGNEGTVAHYGVDCAARLITSTGTKTSGKEVHNLGKAINYAEKWVAHYGRDDYKALAAIASAVGVRYNVWAWVEGDIIHMKTADGTTVV